MSDDELRLTYARIPPAIFAALMRHKTQSQPFPHGGFLQAVLENNLILAVRRADADNREALALICQFIWMEMPAQSWGSPRKVDAWISGACEKANTTRPAA